MHYSLKEIRSFPINEHGWIIFPNGNYVKIGKHVEIGNHVKIGDDVEIGDYVEIGNHVEIGNDVEIGDYVEIGNDVEIGDYVKIGYCVKIEYGAKIGNHVEIGNHVKIGDDVEIGDYVKINNIRSILTFNSKYVCNEYQQGSIRIGCEIHPIQEFKNSLHDLCMKHDEIELENIFRFYIETIEKYQEQFPLEMKEK